MTADTALQAPAMPDPQKLLDALIAHGVKNWEGWDAAVADATADQDPEEQTFAEEDVGEE